MKNWYLTNAKFFSHEVCGTSRKFICIVYLENVWFMLSVLKENTYISWEQVQRSNIEQSLDSAERERVMIWVYH